MDGLVHIYMGNGKGKTTAALGLGVRACGSGMKVLMVQFLKSSNTSELNSINKLKPEFNIMRGFQCKKFVWKMMPEEFNEAKAEAIDIFEKVKKEILSGEYQLVILDELLDIISLKFIDSSDVAEIIKCKPKQTELVMTGRTASDELIELADYVSQIQAVKHPYEKGILARKGIEF